MARRKKRSTSKRRTSKRRGIAGFGGKMAGTKDIAMTLAGTIAGEILGNYLQNKIMKTMFLKKDGTGSTIVKPLIPTAAGIFLTGKMKNPLLRGMGIGLAASGAKNIVYTFAPKLEGMGAVDIAGIMENISIGEDITVGELGAPTNATDITIGAVTIGDVMEEAYATEME